MIYHLESKLDRHLVFACLQSGICCLENSIDNDEFIFLTMVTALFHDIGKPVSENVNLTYNHKSYKGHGWMGQVLWIKIMLEFKESDDFNKYFSNNSHILVGQGIGYHMCGLHRSDCQNCLTQSLQKFLSILPNETKQLLMILNQGDVLGSVKRDFNLEMYLESRKAWAKYLTKENTLIEALSEIKNWYNGIIITLHGPSGSGKSTSAKHIKNILDDKAVWIQRDLIMIECIHKWLNENYEQTNIDFVSNQLKLDEDIFNNLLNQCISNKDVMHEGLGYKFAYSLYKKLNFSHLVNLTIRKKTKKALKEKKIIIGDSMIYGTMIKKLFFQKK